MLCNGFPVAVALLQLTDDAFGFGPGGEDGPTLLASDPMGHGVPDAHGLLTRRRGQVRSVGTEGHDADERFVNPQDDQSFSG